MCSYKWLFIEKSEYFLELFNHDGMYFYFVVMFRLLSIGILLGLIHVK